MTPWWCVPSVFCKWAGPVRFAYNLTSTRDPIPFPSASHSPSHRVDHLQEPAKRGAAVTADSPASKMASGRRGHNSRTQARNKLGQFSPEPVVVTVTDSDSNNDSGSYLDSDFDRDLNVNEATETTAVKPLV